MPGTIPRLVVEVFENPNYTGMSTLILDPVRNTVEIGFERNISSVKIYKGPGFNSGPTYKAIFYDQPNFMGRKIALTPGFYPDLATVAYEFGDVISSVNFGPDLRPAGPDWGSIPVIVEVFKEPNFQGERAIILRDIAFTQTIGLQDAIQSFRITKGPNFPSKGCKVVFYEHIDFGGAAFPINMTAADNTIEVPDLRMLPEGWSGQVSSVRIEGWSSSQEFTLLVFNEEFNLARLDKVWRWEDPRGFGQWASNQGYLQMNVQSGVDLWHGLNYDAPRLLQKVSGDFAIETRMPVTPQLREHGGLIVWKDRGAFVRLEKTSGPHAFAGDVRFERHYPGGFQLVGRGQGLINVKQLYLRLERRGNVFNGFASEDGENWQSCGQTVCPMRDPVEVGMHALCPGSIPPTVTRFDYFRVFRRTRDAGLYRAVDTSSATGTGQLRTLTTVRRLIR